VLETRRRNHVKILSSSCRLVYCLLEIKSSHDSQTEDFIIPNTNEAVSVCARKKKKKNKKTEKYV